MLKLLDKLKLHFLFAVMSLQRITSLKDEEAYTSLIKLYLEDPKRSTMHWTNSDMDFVVGHHAGFLWSVAQTGCSLNETVLAEHLKDMFACSIVECKDFAGKLAQALFHCRTKTKPGRIYSGLRQEAGVLQVIATIKGAGGDHCVQLLIHSSLNPLHPTHHQQRPGCSVAQLLMHC